MSGQEQNAAPIFDIAGHGPLGLLGRLLAAILILAPAAQAQTFSVLHSFTGGGDGNTPWALVADQAGNLYGTTESGGAGYGVIFKLHPTGSGWTLSPIYTFQGGNDGDDPIGVSFGPDGTLYGTTVYGGSNNCSPNGCGTVFKLTPQATACKSALCPWTETILHTFDAHTGGAYPPNAVVFDAAGNLYGTVLLGGPSGEGLVYELSRSGSNWTETVLYQFASDTGDYAVAGLVFDQAGNLYGATADGGPCCGMIYELTPSGGGWTEQTLHNFQGGDDGGQSSTNLLLAPSGELFGATLGDPSGGNGTVFGLTPSNGGWTYDLLFNLPAYGPYAGFTMDAAGNLYGVDRVGQDPGAIFKLTPSGSGWIYTTLYTFSCGSDGCLPNTVIVGANGNLYGTASGGGSYGHGTVWEIAQ